MRTIGAKLLLLLFKVAAAYNTDPHLLAQLIESSNDFRSDGLWALKTSKDIKVSKVSQKEN